MRCLVAASLLVVPAILHAGCTRDSTKAEPRTLFGQLGVKALHLDQAGGTAQMNGSSVGIAEGAMAVAHCRLPAYTLSIIGGGNVEWKQTDYVAPGSTNFHPAVSLHWSGVEVARRWRDSSIFHPMVAIATGSMTAEYYYSQRRADGIWETRVDGHSSARFTRMSVGLEASLFKYMSLYWVTGTRTVGRLSTPNVDRLSGAYSLLGVGFGKFR